jgi:hypothetical protein
LRRKITYIALGLLFILYVLMEIYKPREQDWSLSLSREDKNPYGSYILYDRLKDIFPKAEITSYRKPVYDQVNNSVDSNTAYLLIDPSVDLSKDDVAEILKYVAQGNYVFLSANFYGRDLLDTLHFNNDEFFYAPLDKRNGNLNFTNQTLLTDSGYTCKRYLVDGFFSRFDSSRYEVLGKFNSKEVNFIRIPWGHGAFLVHASPLCFSNYFLMLPGKDDYTAKALSYIPKTVGQIYWDEFYKLGPEGSDNPLRYFLNNQMLRWALRLAFLAMVIYVFFESKRRQRIIPVIEPLKNTTLDFVGTVGNVYYERRDNKNIALKKINYLMDFIRNRLFISTSLPEAELVRAVAHKTGVPEAEVQNLFTNLNRVQEVDMLDDVSLIAVSNMIDEFYVKAQ